MCNPSRREFLKSTVTTACSAGLSACGFAEFLTASPALGGTLAPPATLPIKKGVLLDMLPAKLSYAERMKMARDVGFEVMQAPTTPDEHLAEEIKKAADGANLRNAKVWGSDAVLLVPAVVNPQTSYRDAWSRSQKEIRKLLPLAEELRIVIAIEEVWNKFLLSPLEMATYIGEFQSPWIQAWFDVGNVVLYGYPQDWIRTLGKSIVKVHLKDFKRKQDGYEWVNLGDGDVDWEAVREAFREIGYSGSAITELKGGDEAYLRDVSRRVDRLVLGRG